jgi:CopG family nickel-responsive transcriptional regulator
VPKKDGLVRFGVAMEASLLSAFDALVKERASSRSELLRDLARAEVTRAEVASGADAVATVTLVYDHHVRDLTERLMELQHGLGGRVRSTMHVHLDASHCLEVIILQGRADELRQFAERVFATRGVKHGGIEMIAAGEPSDGGLHVHLHAHDHAGGHAHAPGHADHEHERTRPRPRARRARA